MGLGFAYTSLGYTLKQQGDFRAARQYYLTAIPLLEQEGNTWNLSEAFVNLGDMSRWLFEIDTARAYYQRAAQVYPESKGRLAEHLGWSYSDEGRYREALAYFQESCRLGPCAEELARIMAYCSEALGDTTEANRQFQLALESAPTARDSGKVQWYIGNTLLRRKQHDKALLVFQQALHNFFPKLRADDLRDNPHTGLSADFWPIQILRGKAQAFRARHAQTGAVQDLKQAWSAVSTAVVALDTLRTGMRNEISGQDAVDYAYSTYETGIQIALDLDRAEPGRGHTSRAYEMAEHAK
ncbi:MAG: tetratricopeptide repeat protein, partial [Saprospiraceae bacterium]|nr:tetratricopeptide repeat protein [Saprospiraceae bacterium]